MPCCCGQPRQQKVAAAGPDGLPVPLDRFLIRVDVRADCRNAVRVNAAQAEVHSTAQIWHCPIRPVRHGSEARIVERAVGIRAAVDRVALTKMTIVSLMECIARQGH